MLRLRQAKQFTRHQRESESSKLTLNAVSTLKGVHTHAYLTPLLYAMPSCL